MQSVEKILHQLCIPYEGHRIIEKMGICGDHFLPEDYFYPSPKYLRKNAVPSVFNFPSHLQKQVTTPQREIKRTLLNETPPLPNETPVIK